MCTKKMMEKKRKNEEGEKKNQRVATVTGDG